MQPLFGLETEYAFVEAATPRRRRRSDESVIALVKHAQQQCASLSLGGSLGIFLANGARFYIDTGPHPEFCTPECSNPRDVVRYALAGDRILAKSARAIASSGAGEPLLFKSNVDYLRGHTWGCHESYLTKKAPEDLAPGLVPHLVTRVIYAGAGGFEPFRRGLRFVLSPRAYFLKYPRSNVSTESRGLIHHRDEPLAGKKFRRLHLICGDSLCSQQAQFLKVGTTALVVALIEQGLWRRNTSLADPIAALHKLARDTSCRSALTLADAREATAIDVQWQYLLAVERYANSRYLPDWAEEVCSLWRATLGRLELGPDAVATSLDWAIKLQLFIGHTERCGFRWEDLEAWFQALCGNDTTLAKASCEQDPAIVFAPDPLLDHVLHEHGIDPARHPDLLALYHQLIEIDARFSQIGGNGIFDRLDALGNLDHRLDGLNDADIEAAVVDPPAHGRARERGAWIRRLAGEPARYHVNWDGILDMEGNRYLDLSDPYGRDVEWKQPPGDDILSLRESRILRSMRIRARASANPPDTPPPTEPEGGA